VTLWDGVTLWEIVVDALQWFAIGAASFALWRSNRTMATVVEYTNQESRARSESQRAIFERLYTKTNRRLSEHIQSRLH
jgi:hypothetical protein